MGRRDSDDSRIRAARDSPPFDTRCCPDQDLYQTWRDDLSHYDHWECDTCPAEFDRDGNILNVDELEEYLDDEFGDSDDDYRSLTDITGVGDDVAKQLRRAGYNSIEAIQHATQHELSNVEGVSNALAARMKADVGSPIVTDVSTDGTAGDTVTYGDSYDVRSDGNHDASTVEVDVILSNETGALVQEETKVALYASDTDDTPLRTDHYNLELAGGKYAKFSDTIDKKELEGDEPHVVVEQESGKLTVVTETCESTSPHDDLLDALGYWSEDVPYSGHTDCYSTTSDSEVDDGHFTIDGEEKDAYIDEFTIDGLTHNHGGGEGTNHNYVEGGVQTFIADADTQENSEKLLGDIKFHYLFKEGEKYRVEETEDGYRLLQHDDNGWHVVKMETIETPRLDGSWFAEQYEDND